MLRSQGEKYNLAVAEGEIQSSVAGAGVQITAGQIKLQLIS